MLKRFFFGSLIFSMGYVASNLTQKQTPLLKTVKTEHSNPPTAFTKYPNFTAVKWYRESAARNAMYRQIFAMAEKRIKEEVSYANLPPYSWGIVLDIDESVIDNSSFIAV